MVLEVRERRGGGLSENLPRERNEVKTAHR
jgi:hypothetical protein